MNDMSDVPMETIRADFDRLAHLDADGWSHNSHYHPFLLRQLPPRLDTALEIGCGRGAFARLLADRARQVVALDLSNEMIRLASDASAAYPNIEYRQGDILEWEVPAEAFDCVAAIATLHHIPLEPVLRKVKDTLKPGGMLLVLDLYQAHTALDYIWGAAGIPASRLTRLLKTGWQRPSHEAQEAWAAHGQHDSYLTLGQVRAAAAGLPGAQVRRHLLWRYSLVWRKP